MGAPRRKITRNGTNASRKGPSEYFADSVRIDTPFSTTASARDGGACVTFEPGARTAWHAHPLGQTLIVAAGRGWVQSEGAARKDIQPGDVVWFPPGVRNRHPRHDSFGHLRSA